MKYEYGYLVDNVWKCGCGSLNAAYKEECPKCGKPNPKVKKDE